MDLISTLQMALAAIYVLMIVDAIFSSTRNVMEKQRAFEGRLLFLLYSLLVYYKDFSFNIFLWDALLNEPIKQAYTFMDTLLTDLLGVSIQQDPMFIFTFLIPAAFVFYFTEYWIRYGFNDRRISRLISFLAVVLFLRSGGLGLIGFFTIPLGSMFLGNFFIASLISIVPSEGFFEVGFIPAEFMPFVLLLVAFLLILLLNMILTKFLTESFGEKSLILVLILAAASVFLVFFSGTSLKVWAYPALLVLGLMILAVIGEILIFIALHLFYYNFFMAFPRQD